MARIAVLAGALALMLAPAAGAATETADQFLEGGSLTPNTTSDHPVTTTTSLQNGHTYRLVLTGVSTTHWPAGDVGFASWPPFDEEDDALYCVHQNPVPLGDDCSNGYVQKWSGVGVQVGDNPYNAGLSVLTDTALPPPSANHAYEITFVSSHSGVMKLWDLYAGHYGASGYPSSATGSFGFQLFGTKGTGGSPPSGGGSAPTAWRIGPVRFWIPAGGKSFKGNSYRFTVQSARKAVVRETLTAYLGKTPYKAGKVSGVLAAGKAYNLSVKIPKATVTALLAGLQTGQLLTMRSVITVVSVAGKLTRRIDVPFQSG